MKKKLIFAFLISIFFDFTVNAQHQELPVVTKTYEQYLQNTKNQCEQNDVPWKKYNSLVPVPQYPKLESSAVNAQITSPNLENLSWEEKERLKKDLSLERIGSFQGFKTLEVARLQYRSTMNSLFACSAIESRLLILGGLREALGGEISSEIKSLLDKEQKKLETQKSDLSCVSHEKKEVPAMQELVNSAAKQYCHFRHYLSYLDDNLRDDYTTISDMEKNIWTGKWQMSSNTIQSWVNSYNSYVNALQTEIARAETTLPRVLKAYKEMERSYSIHLMLLIIYDDYIRLRKNLATYMNASTQLYMKAHNAQDSNNK